LFLIDNSQGHSAYADNALLILHMNINLGGKQAQMKDGWFIDAGGQKVIQPMMFPSDHHDHPNEPKGIKAVLQERGLLQGRHRGRCQSKCPDEATSCCLKRILELQPDFAKQKPLVQDVIEAAGHLCIFLPKYHCELNFIEFFWGGSKEVSARELRLHLRNAQDQLAEGYGFRTSQYNPFMGTSDAQVDECLPVGSGDENSTVAGQGVQFKEVQIS
jgi:hypothetical protein